MEAPTDSIAAPAMLLHPIEKDTMPMTSTDRFEKQIVLDSPRSRVWRAVTDAKEFGEWFGVALTSAFTVGGVTSGNIAMKGYEHLVVTFWVDKIEPQHYFSFRWHPDCTDATMDYSKEPTTLVELKLVDVDGGTELTIVESGFDAIPESRRAKAFASNGSGWEQQTRRIAAYLKSHG
jgi:uncharacterized protein YndB with AHSA1/START domain